MASRNDKYFVVGMVVLVVVAFVYMQDKDSLLTEFFNTFAPPNWDEVISRNIVKNSIPLTLLESNNGQCIVKAELFHSIIDHAYFLKGEQLAEELNFDRNLNTLTIPCEKLVTDKSELTIWYATEEAGKHATKYQYWINPWNNTSIKNIYN